MRQLNTFELRVIVHAEVWDNNPDAVTNMLKQRAEEEVRAQNAELDGEIEITSSINTARDEYVVMATGRAWTGEETQGPVDMCPTCGQEGFCPCGDQASPREEEVEAVV